MTNARPHIVVVGSINMDLVARMSRLPKPGETVHSDDFQTVPGGKGANQAVAAARLGARVTMIGRLGDDSFGDILRAGLIANSVDVEHVLVTSDCSSGVALIGVEATGANSITVVAGANARLTPHDVNLRADVIASADALIVQLETPVETVAAAIRIAREAGVRTILDPAPAPSGLLPSELMSVDILSPNQTEAEALTGVTVTDLAQAREAAFRLRELGARSIVLKLSELGALVMDEEQHEQHIPARPARVVDTTAAGDAFTAALAVALSEGRSLRDATHFGCAAGTLACTSFGAQPALPMIEAVLQWIAEPHQPVK